MLPDFQVKFSFDELFFGKKFANRVESIARLLSLYFFFGFGNSGHIRKEPFSINKYQDFLLSTILLLKTDNLSFNLYRLISGLFDNLLNFTFFRVIFFKIELFFCATILHPFLLLCIIKRGIVVFIVFFTIVYFLILYKM